MPNALMKYKDQIRQILADLSDQKLPDYSTEDPESNLTYPRHKMPLNLLRDSSAVRKGTTIAMAALKSPAVAAEILARDFIAKKYNELKEKQASIHDELDNGIKVSSSMVDSALSVLKDTTPVSVVILALRRIFGDEFYGWEPETIFYDLDDMGVPVNDDLQEKINCGLCLALQPAFMNDVLVFENCVRVLGDLNVDVSVVQKSDIPYLCAALYEAKMLMERENKLPPDAMFTADIEMYCGLALQHDHYMLAPVELEFCQKYLETLNKNNGLILPSLRKHWIETKKKLEDEKSIEFKEDILGVQLSKLTGCWLYVKERMDKIQMFTDMLSQ